FITGIPSLQVPSIDPLESERIDIDSGKSAVQLVQKYKNVKIYGLATSKIKNIHFDVAAKVLTFTVYIPKLQQIAHYECKGKILLLPIYGSGNSSIVLERVTMATKINFKEERINGNVHFKIKSYKILLSLEDVHIHLENLFNGDTLLGDNMNKVLDEHGLDLFNDVKNHVEDSYGQLCKKVAMSLFDNIPVKELLLE
ncbi:hypothetical protein NQ318_011855, partial [Aromia moschata]